MIHALRNTPQRDRWYMILLCCLTSLFTVLCLQSCSVTKHKTHSADRVQKETIALTDSTGSSTQTWTNITTTKEAAPDSVQVAGDSLIWTIDEWGDTLHADTADTETLAETGHIKLERIQQPGKKPALKVTVKPQTV
ncbi:MAG: hypothetical protein ACTHKV_14840, partial [Flavipsychrobacter sp.]